MKESDWAIGQRDYLVRYRVGNVEGQDLSRISLKQRLTRNRRHNEWKRWKGGRKATKLVQIWGGKALCSSRFCLLSLLFLCEKRFECIQCVKLRFSSLVLLCFLLCFSLGVSLSLIPPTILKKKQRKRFENTSNSPLPTDYILFISISLSLSLSSFFFSFFIFFR